MQKETVQKLADRHDIEARYAPGYGDHAFRLTITNGSKNLSDVFVIEADLTDSEVGVSDVEGQAQRTEITEAVPLVKAFRIKKPKLSTITIRRPLGQVEV